MSEAKRTYAVVAPLTYTGTGAGGFTYHYEEDVGPGNVVKIPLGRQKSLGVVTAITTKPEFATKSITEILPLEPLPVHLIHLAEWMSRYYFSSAKSVWQTILPAGITKKRRIKKPSESFTLPKQEHPLTDEQDAAISTIQNGNQTSYLLQGITGSGKTRVYLELVAHMFATGKSAIVLIPEIALTPQLIALFEASFPGRIIPYHSALTESQKHQAWQLAHESTQPMVVMGPRSALFLPLKKIGIIIIDECHETSYKQEQNPRYQAVSVAAKLAHLAKAKLVLGSATPSLWEVLLAEAGKIKLVKLTLRATGQPLPQTHIIDLRDKQNLDTSKLISKPLLAAMTETLSRGRQSLLFINRRGSASSQICGHCGNVASCPNCSLPLTFHADHMKLICHLCNFRVTPVAVCTECKMADLRYLGAGTKRIEAEIAKLLPSARLARLDKDSATHGVLQETYTKLHSGTIDILIGTQMIAKGLDLPNLDTIGIVSADTVLHMPDFTASERTFQLIAQVAGRAGRGSEPGNVYIQTHTPDHPSIQTASRHDFWGFVATEMEQRKLLRYPPHRYLLKLSFEHPDAAKAQTEANRMAADLSLLLTPHPSIFLLGPAPAFHERAHGKFMWHIVVKSPNRDTLIEVAASMPPTWKTDLDPVNLL